VVPLLSRGIAARPPTCQPWTHHTTTLAIPMRLRYCQPAHHGHASPRGDARAVLGLQLSRELPLLPATAAGACWAGVLPQGLPFKCPMEGALTAAAAAALSPMHMNEYQHLQRLRGRMAPATPATGGPPPPELSERRPGVRQVPVGAATASMTRSPPERTTGGRKGAGRTAMAA